MSKKFSLGLTVGNFLEENSLNFLRFPGAKKKGKLFR